MSGRAWCFVFAVVGLLAWPNPSVTQTPDCQGVACPSPSEQKQYGTEAGDGQGGEGDFALKVRIIESADDADRAKASEEEARQHDADDLEAQRMAALAARDNADSAWWQVGLAAVGAIGLLISLFFTRQSIGLNRMETDAAVSGNERALMAINQEQANAERAMQAYVSAETAIAAEDGIMSGFIVEFYNSGTTPAIWINTHASFDVIDPAAEIPPYQMDKISIGNYWPAIAGGKSIELIILRGDDVAQAMSEVLDSYGRKTLRLFGRVRYQTVFHDIVESEFAFHTCRPRIAIMEADTSKMMKSNVKTAAYEVVERRAMVDDQPRRDNADG